MHISLDRYFFPNQELNAIADHDPDGVRDQLHTIIEHEIVKSEENENQYVLQLGLRQDDEHSTNPPYNFNITIVGVFSLLNITNQSEKEQETMVLALGSQLLIGAVRERLSVLSNSAPWGNFFLDFIPINPPALKNEKS